MRTHKKGITWSRWTRFSQYLFAPIVPGADRSSWLWTMGAAILFAASVPTVQFATTVGHILFIGQFAAILVPAARFGWKGALAGFVLCTTGYLAALATTIALPSDVLRPLPDIGLALGTGLGMVLVCGGFGSAALRQRELVDKLGHAEARLRAMIDAMPSGLLVLDRCGNIIFSNSSARQLLSTDRPEECGVHLRTLVAQEAWPQFRSRLVEPVRGEIIRVTIPGEDALRTEWTFARFTDEGQPRTMAFFWDAEEKLIREEEGRALAAALKCLQEGVILANLDGTIRYANAAAAQIYGYGNRHEFIGTSLRDHVAPGDLGGFEARMERARTTGGQCELRLLRPDGGETEVHVTTSPVRADDQLIGTVGVIRDLTEAKFLARRATAADKQATLGRLVAGAAHEINNPLTAILASAELLKATVALPGDGNKQLETITDECARAGRIVRDLLAFARQRPVARVPVELADVVRTAVALREGYTRSAGVELTFNTPSPAPVEVDIDQIKQVVLNLLVNAEDAVAGRKDRRISVTIGRRAGRALLLVNDSGPGVSDEIQHQIFEPFFTTKPDGQGTGLGLSVIAGIVSEHGGRISVDRGVLGGAQFAVEFPLAEAAQLPPAEVPLTASAPSSRALRILVVDDEPAIVNAVGRILQRLGHQVVTANGGGDGLAAALTESFDVIISDLRMPGLSGRELHARLTAEGILPKTDFIVATGDIADPEAFAFLQATGLPVLLKPFEIRNLVETLSQTGAGRRCEVLELAS